VVHFGIPMSVFLPQALQPCNAQEACRMLAKEIIVDHPREASILDSAHRRVQP
jgi:hypothetical protein